MVALSMYAHAYHSILLTCHLSNWRKIQSPYTLLNVHKGHCCMSVMVSLPQSLLCLWSKLEVSLLFCRSFQGFCCLMQLSTRTADYLVDVIALRSIVGPVLAPIFADAKVSQPPQPILLMYCMQQATCWHSMETSAERVAACIQREALPSTALCATSCIAALGLVICQRCRAS